MFFRLTDVQCNSEHDERHAKRLTIASCRSVKTFISSVMLGPTSCISSHSSCSLAHAERSRSVSLSRKSMAVTFHGADEPLYSMAGCLRGSSDSGDHTPDHVLHPGTSPWRWQRYTRSCRDYVTGVLLLSFPYVQRSRGGRLLTLHPAEGPQSVLGSSTSLVDSTTPWFQCLWSQVKSINWFDTPTLSDAANWSGHVARHPTQPSTWLPHTHAPYTASTLCYQTYIPNTWSNTHTHAPLRKVTNIETVYDVPAS